MLRFGVFEADLQARARRNQGMQIKLQDQPFQVLVVLLDQAGEIVTREQLRQELWPADTFVDVDNSVNAAINRLREALGDSAESPRFVETLPRRGYRFVAQVTEVKSVGGGSASRTAHSVFHAQPDAIWLNGSRARKSWWKFAFMLGISATLLLVAASIWAWQRWQLRTSAL